MATTVPERLREVFGSVLGVDPATVDDDYSTETVTSWDSVHHLQLLLAIEDEFDLRFDVEEIADLTSFGAIRQRVEAAVGAGSRQE